MSLQDTRTSTPAASIWRDLTENDFRRHLVVLEEMTNAVPIDSARFPISAWDDDPATHRSLTIQVEQQLADDFAFLASVEEGAQSVAAACLEEHISPPRLTIRYAAIDVALDVNVKIALAEVAAILASPSRVAACVIPPEERISEMIVRLHHERLLGRLRSAKWDKPKHLARSHKKPLWQDFANVIHRVQFLFSKGEAQLRDQVVQMLKQLEHAYKDFETVSKNRHFGWLKDAIVKASFVFCRNESVQAFARRLHECCKSGTPTKQVAAAMKCLRQVEKIGAYWRVACSMVSIAKRYPVLFQEQITMEYLMPYRGIPTTIGYESWATTSHVHAEVQLAVYYDLSYQQPSLAETDATNNTLAPPLVFHRPRCIGTSKWLCYLCYHFLKAHGTFFTSATHGRLYDQWTIPDLSTFSLETCQRYREIVAYMDVEILKRTREVCEEAKKHETTAANGKKEVLQWRPEPMTSRQNLLDMDSNT